MIRPLAKLLMLLFAFSSCKADEAFERWWQDQIRLAQPDALRGKLVRWSVQWPTPSQQELARMRSEVQGKPDHPDRQRLEVAVAQERLGNPPQDNRLWTSSDGQRTRLACDTPGGSAPHIDLALRDSESWTLVPGALTLRNRTSTDLSTDTVYALDGFVEEASLALSGGISSCIRRGIDLRTPTPRLSVDGSWRGEWTQNGPSGVYSVTAVGRFSSESRTGTVSRLELRHRSSKGEWSGVYLVRMADRREGDLPRNVQVEQLDDGSTLTRSIALTAAEAVSDDVVDAHTRIPEVNGVDPVRGVMTFRAISDERDDEQRVTRLQSARGDWREITGPKPQSRPPVALMYWGWAAVGVIVLILVIVKARRG